MDTHIPALLKRAADHPVTRNAASLYAIQAANYVFPLIVVPYLARVLRPSGYGLVLLAQSLAVWLALVVEYGFGLSATREIAKRRDDRPQVGAIAGGVLGAEAFLALLAAASAVASGWFIRAFRAQPEFLLLAWLSAVAQAIAPVWYFQGIERMTYPAGINVGIRAVVTGLTFVWVRTPEDAWKVLVLQSIGGVVAAGILLARLRQDVPLAWPKLRTIIEALRMGWSMFFFRSAASLYTMANTFILGFFVPPDRVAFYGGPERVSKAILSGLAPISQALYPRMSWLAREDVREAARAGRMALLSIGLLGVGLGVTTWVVAPVIVRLFFGSGYEAAIPVLRILSGLIPAGTISNLLGVQWLLPNGMDRLLSTIVAGGGVLNIALAIVLAPRMGAVGMAIAVLTTEVTMPLTMFVVLWRRRSPLLRLVQQKD
jgi:PST family polysaccharide transporter